MEVKLLVLEGKQKNREIPLPETIFLIGRDRQCHLRPHCQLVSKLHCAIAAWAGKVRVRDLKSRNGTFLNGQPIQGEVVVNDGDQLQVGTLVFAFRIRNEEGIPMPVPIKDERHLQWLLEQPSDSAVLAPGSETCVVAVPSELDSSGEAAKETTNGSSPAVAIPTDQTPGSKAISAGQHLRTYLEGRKRRPAPEAEPNSEPN